MGVVNEIIKIINQSYLNGLLVVGNNGVQKEDKVYANIIIGLEGYYNEFTKNLPNLSKGLGWKVKNNLHESSKARKGKGQLIKYARAYLEMEQPLTHI